MHGCVRTKGWGIENGGMGIIHRGQWTVERGLATSSTTAEKSKIITPSTINTLQSDILPVLIACSRLLQRMRARMHTNNALYTVEDEDEMDSNASGHWGEVDLCVVCIVVRWGQIVDNGRLARHPLHSTAHSKHTDLQPVYLADWSLGGCTRQMYSIREQLLPSASSGTISDMLPICHLAAVPKATQYYNTITSTTWNSDADCGSTQHCFSSETALALVEVPRARFFSTPLAATGSSAQ